MASIDSPVAESGPLATFSTLAAGRRIAGNIVL